MRRLQGGVVRLFLFNVFFFQVSAVIWRAFGRKRIPLALRVLPVVITGLLFSSSFDYLGPLYVLASIYLRSGYI